jgi:hypothetical protein
MSVGNSYNKVFLWVGQQEQKNFDKKFCTDNAVQAGYGSAQL